MPFALRELIENDDKFRGVEITSEGTVPLIMRDGRAWDVAKRYASEKDPRIRQAILEGIGLGVTHCALTGGLPTRRMDRSQGNA